MTVRKFIVEKSETAIDTTSAISAMRDSVWVIDSELQKEDYEGKKEVIARNVAHLELMMANLQISESNQDLSDVTAAIETGNSFLNA
jgi:hypothetical protein